MVSYCILSADERSGVRECGPRCSDSLTELDLWEPLVVAVGPVIGFVVKKNKKMTFYKICTTESLTVNTDLAIHACAPCI